MNIVMCAINEAINFLVDHGYSPTKAKAAIITHVLMMINMHKEDDPA